MEYVDVLGRHKGILLTHLNIRSLWSKIDLTRSTFTSKNIDIATFSETWLTNEIPDELINFKGYTLFRKDRTWSDGNGTVPKKGGGLCMYVKDNLNVKVDHINHMDISTRDVECQAIEIIYENQKNVIVLNLYRPPQGNIENFIDYIDRMVNSIDIVKKDVFILGDYNIDFLDKSDTNTKKINRLISQLGLFKLISTPTRFGNYKNSCIDQIISNSIHVLDAGVDDINLSDHKLIYVIKRKRKSHTGKANFQGRSYRNYDVNNFETSLNEKLGKLF